jgi:hypothetical protein
MKLNYKLVANVLVACYCFYYLSTIETWHFIDNVNLIIHEAGHVVFFLFGTFLYIAGGSLLQLIMPALFVWYFYKTNQKSSMPIVIYWLAINFFSVAHYASDAVDMKLELLGGDSSGHDWNNLLTMTHLLGLTKPIAGLIYACGIICIFWGLYIAFQTVQEQRS